MNQSNQLLNYYQAVNQLGSKIHTPKEDRFPLIIGIVAVEQAKHGHALAKEIQSGMGLGYLRTNQLLNEMVKKKYLNQVGAVGCGAYAHGYTLGARMPSDW